MSAHRTDPRPLSRRLRPSLPSKGRLSASLAAAAALHDPGPLLELQQQRRTAAARSPRGGARR